MVRSRSVSFEAKPAYSRLPHDDEKYVMREFAKHAGRCKSCRNPYQTHLAGEALCSRGRQLALDVAQYVYIKAGNAFSVVDREGRARQEVQIEVPAGCDAVRGLLRAMDRGLRVARDDPSSRGRHQRRQSGSGSMDRTYYVAPRPAAAAAGTKTVRRSSSNSSSGSNSSAGSSAAASASSRSSVESVPSSSARAARAPPAPATRAEASRYYYAAPACEARPRLPRAYPVATSYVPRERCRDAQAYYSFPAYQNPRRSGIAVWS